MSGNYGNFLKSKSRRRRLSDGQGARKRKPARSHRGPNGRRHKAAFADLPISARTDA